MEEFIRNKSQVSIILIFYFLADNILLVVIFAPGRCFWAYLLIGWGKDSPCLPGAPGLDLPTETLSAQKNPGLPLEEESTP